MIPDGLTKYIEAIINVNVYDQSIDYYIDTWRNHLGRNYNLEFIGKKYPNKITRKNLFDLASNAKQTGDIEDLINLFLGTMIWGYGTTGYGAWRTKEMFSTSNFKDVIQRSFELILENNFIGAYEIFQIKRCGPPFFTKYFYFIGYGCGLSKYPLILDTNVYNALKDKIQINISWYVKKSTWWYPMGYIRYVNAMHQWADELECEAHNIEYFLFKLGG